MTIFSKKVELSLSEKLAGFKSIFTEAHTGAVALKEEIDAEKQSCLVAIANAKAAMTDVEKLEKENDKFIADLSKLV